MNAQANPQIAGVANRLVELCRQGQYAQAQTELYHEEAESFEPNHAPVPYVKGIEAIKGKGEAWNQMIETVNGGFVSDPLIAGNHFTITMGMDVTYKDGNRQNMEEVCVYEVKDGKVVKEQFFF